MTLNLYLSPSNETALQHMRGRIREAKQRDPLAPVHLLLPSGPVIVSMRQWLGDSANVHLFQFYRLGRVVLNASQTSPIYEMQDTATRRLVRHLLAQMAWAGELSTFEPVWDKPGFISVMLDWLREVKSRGILPEAVWDEARRTGTPRDRQLAAFYQRYQDFLLENDLSDADGLLWLAADALAADQTLFQHDAPLFVYGFDQFSPIQRRILQVLDSRYSHTGIYLLWDPHRTAESLALTRLADTRRLLEEELAAECIHLDAPTAPAENEALVHLRRTLFGQQAPTVPTGDRVQLVEAPSREGEVRWALRSAKRLLLDGVRAEEIALLVPSPDVYRRLVETVAEEYDVPVQVEMTLGASPPVVSLLNLLTLTRGDDDRHFPWRRTFDALRSPYLDCSRWLSPQQIDQLDQLTRDRPVVAGREQWDYALQPIELKREPQALDADEELGDAPLAAILTDQELDDLRNGLNGLFDHLTPPLRASHRAYTLWIQEAILGLFEGNDVIESRRHRRPPSLWLMERCEEGNFPERDRLAMRLVLTTLRQSVSAAELVPSGEQVSEPETSPDGGELVTWETFSDDLLAILPSVSVHPVQDGARIRFDVLDAGRGLTPDYLFVLGLSEGEFPAPPAPDVLYTSTEREASPLPLQQYRPGDDASLWWQITGNVGRRLVLLRPWLDENGAEWPPSPYWQAVTRAVEASVERLKVAETVQPREAASGKELLVALAARRTVLRGHPLPPELAQAWTRAARAQTLLRRRNSWDPPGIFEGVLQSENLRAEIAAHYGADHVWSASRLNRFGVCPFGFFVKHVLELDPRPDPEEGLDAARRGSLLHAVLEEFFGRLSEAGMAPTRDNQEQVLAWLDEICDRIFARAPRRYGFRRGRLWQYEQGELRRQLHALIRWECEENAGSRGDSPRFWPYEQELAFGTGDELPPAVLTAPGDRTLLLRGFIDRIDRDADGNLRIIDYKSGSTEYYGSDVAEGRSLQTTLYAQAVQTLLDDAVVHESYYVHIPSRNISGRIDLSTDSGQARLQQGLAAAARAVGHVQAGRFPSSPSKLDFRSGACTAWCELAAVCRPDRRSRYKGRQLLEGET